MYYKDKMYTYADIDVKYFISVVRELVKMIALKKADYEKTLVVKPTCIQSIDDLLL